MATKTQAKGVLTTAVETGKVKNFRGTSSKDTHHIVHRAAKVMHQSLNSAYTKNAALLDHAKKMTKVMAELQSMNLTVKEKGKGLNLSQAVVKEINTGMNKVYNKLKAQKN